MKKILFLILIVLAPMQLFSQTGNFMGAGIKIIPMTYSVPFYIIRSRAGLILEMNVNSSSFSKATDLSDVMEKPFTWWQERDRKKALLFVGIGYLKKIKNGIFIKFLGNFGDSEDVVKYYSTASEQYFILKENEKAIYGGEIGMLFFQKDFIIDFGMSYPGILHFSLDFKL